MQVHSTKILQDKSWKIEQPLLQKDGNILCPIAALDRMFQVIPAHDDAPVFCTPLGNPIIYWTFNKFIKDILDRAGLVGDKYSTHSFRRGGWTFAAACGLQDRKLMKMGDWKSNCFTEYIHSNLQDKLDVARGMTQGIIHLQH